MASASNLAPLQTYVGCGNLLLGATGSRASHSNPTNPTEASAERQPVI